MLKKKGVKKKFVRRGIGQAAFFKSLNDAGVRYALLRWWKDFPNLAEGEDFDVLIRSEIQRWSQVVKSLDLKP